MARKQKSGFPSPVANDQCITPDRQILIAINTAFDDVADYGYTINTNEFTVPVNGNDDTNDGANCAAIEPGDTEEFIGNHAPTFDNPSPTLEVDENTEAGEDIGTPVRATDPESDTLTYSLQGQDGASFNIDSSTGQIKTKAPLDHETKDTYHVAVFVRDSKNLHGNPDTVNDNSIDVTINVTDVNEAPEFNANAPTTLSVVENTDAGENIGQAITATDPDDGDTVTYSLDDGDGASFEIDSDGQIKTFAALDYESDPIKRSYNVTVTASDGDLEATQTVTITIDNEVEPPTFTDGDSGTTREVAENTPAGQPVGDPVSATSEEGHSLTYSLGGMDSSSFEIDSGTGQIKTKSGVDLDYEGSKNTYSVTLSVTDGRDSGGNQETSGNETEDDSIGVTINVTDVNEPPAFADTAPATLDITENTETNTNIANGLFTATDPDTGETLTYSLDDGDGAAFDIDADGRIKTKGPLNHETKETYNVTVSVRDSRDDNGDADTATDDTHAVTITVTDQDEDGTITFSAEPPSAGTRLTATLADDDGVKSSPAVTWKWESSSNGTDTWTEITGETTDSYTPGTDDIGDYLRVTATYGDSFGDDKTATGTTGAVADRPATNQQPSFASNAATTLSVAENTLAGTNIGDAYTATQADSKGTLVYSLDTTGADNFDIDSTNGQLKTKTVFNYETDAKLSYTVTVSVTDGLDDHSLSDGVVDGTITVTVNVTDVNEPPQFADDAAATLEVSEATSTGTDIGNAYTATDPENDTLTYSLTGTDASLFTVGTDGQLQVADTLDFESKPSLSVTINVTDSMDAAGNAEAIDDTHEVTITVTNVFEDPRFGDEDGTGSTTRSVPENTPADQPIGAPVSADDDEESTLTYELTGTDSDSDSFSFDSASGQIKTKDPLDHEAKDSYSVTVSVSDGKDAADGTTADTRIDTTITVTIEVEDVNEKPAFADGAVTDLSIAENTAADQDIGAAFTATDPDEDPADTLTYGLEGTDAASFDIDMATGQIKTKGDLDHEGKETYSVTVTVRDSRDINGDADTATDATIAVTITVTDVDDPGEIRLSPSQPNAGSEVTATLEDDDGVKTTPTVTWKWKAPLTKALGVSSKERPRTLIFPSRATLTTTSVLLPLTLMNSAPTRPPRGCRIPWCSRRRQPTSSPLSTRQLRLAPSWRILRLTRPSAIRLRRLLMMPLAR